mmetsp:Transcript_18688/g.38382  ORF Transcript_18688/g.38382 Transcript_18688/m.38382 type:complete len:778 (+) Transcript_18688:284-2617(+)
MPTQKKQEARETMYIAVEPLIAALFDLPENLRFLPSKNKDTIDNQSLSGTRQGALRPSLPRNKNSTSTSSFWRSHDLTTTRRSFGHDDEGGETDNTSLLHGENISLTDEEFSDAAAHFSSRDQRNRMAEFPTPMQYSTISSHFSNNSVASSSQEIITNSQIENNPVPNEGDAEEPTPKHSSTKKKKKRKSSGRTRKTSSHRSCSKLRASRSSSVEDEDPVEISPVADVKEDLAFYLFQSEEVSLNRLNNLQSKIANIRATIRSLESDLIATRNELAEANNQLNAATVELGEMQRTALEVEIGMNNLTRQHDRQATSSSSFMTPLQAPGSKGSDFDASLKKSYSRGSISSTSSEKMNFFTPTSSLMESGEDSDFSACMTSRSASSSRASFSSDNDISPTQKQEMGSGSPMAKNTTRRNLDSELKGEHLLPYDLDASKLTGLTSTPNTAASTQEDANSEPSSEIMMPPMETNRGENKVRRVTFSRQQSFIRTHDLAVNGCNQSPLLPLHGQGISDVIDALFEKGLEFAMDESDRWIPVRDTEKVLTKRAKQMQNGTFDSQQPMGNWKNAAAGMDVLVWYCPCPHDGHGSEYPMVKARGLIPCSALDIAQLLLDSDRVKQYNKMSLGRTDEQSFATGVERAEKCPATGITGEAKIVRSKSQPPLVRKPIELRILLHARRLTSEEEELKSGARYVTIARSVWETPEGTTDAEDLESTRCEMLLGVNLIRELNAPNSVNGQKLCELTTITHAVSPGIPLVIGKRVGLAAAGKYIADIRNVFE